MIEEILAKRYKETKKFKLGDVTPGELVIVRLPNDGRLGEDDDGWDEYVHRVAMVMRHEKSTTESWAFYVSVHAVGPDDVESPGTVRLLADDLLVVWLTEAVYPIRRLED
jgi:hypothetical protein